jgi:hypothetical protein
MADIQEVRALAALVALVRVGDRAYLTKHDYIADSGECEVTGRFDGSVHFRLDKPRRSQGRTFHTSRLSWPEDDRDYEVDLQRRVLRLYRQSYGSRVVAVTVSFGAGGPDSFRWCGTCGGRVAYSTHKAH